MDKRISELKDLHIKSKPELQKFLMNAEAAIEKRSLPQLIRITHGVQDVVKGYDWVIDELFEEIDRLKAEYSDERAAHNVHVTELIEAQKLIEKLEKTNVKFPRQSKREGGWTVAMDYLKGISDRLYVLSSFGDLGDTPPSLEQIEMVLLAVEESQINWKLKRQFQPNNPNTR